MKSLTGIFAAIVGGDEGAGGTSLRSRVRTGGFFALSGFGISQMIRLFSNLVLTRLVAPEDFGLMAVAISIYIWVIMLTDIGTRASVVRSEHSDDPEYIRTAWCIQILRNGVVWLALVVAAVAVSMLASSGVFRLDSTYADPRLPWVMAAISAQLLITAVTSANASLAFRKIHMGRVVGLELVIQVFMTCVTITFAYFGFGVWALVIGMLSGALVNTVASHFVFEGPSMRFRFKREYALEILHFGKWLIIASTFGFLANRGDQILFGGLMESNSFGQYAVATMWLVAGSTVVGTIINRIVYPAFSEILRDRPHDLTNAYRKIRLLIDGLAVTLAYGVFFLAEVVFSVIYPENFAESGRYIKLLSPFFLILPFRLINTAVLAAGKSRDFTGVTVLSGATMLVLVPAMFHLFGEKAAIVTFASIELVALPIVWRLGSRHIALDPLTEGRILAAMAVLLLLIFSIG